MHCVISLFLQVASQKCEFLKNDKKVCNFLYYLFLMMSLLQIFWVLSPERKTGGRGAPRPRAPGGGGGGAPRPPPPYHRTGITSQAPKNIVAVLGGAEKGAHWRRDESQVQSASVRRVDRTRFCLRMPPQDDRPIGTVYEDKGPKPERGR
jgi:hypothetical protein